MGKKLFKIGCFSVLGLFTILVIIGIFVDSSTNTENDKRKFVDPLNIGLDSLKFYNGKKVPYDNWSFWGIPETLEGTSSKYWVVYLDSANVSFVSNKKLDKVIFIDFQKQSALDFINKIQLERKELIKKQFNNWDGSHYELTKIIKKAMNDPDSYKHDETVYWDMDEYLIVRTMYRGKNAFGGVVRNWVKVKTDIENGSIIEVIEEGR